MPNNAKLENLLNLALAATTEEKEKSQILGTGHPVHKKLGINRKISRKP